MILTPWLLLACQKAPTVETPTLPELRVRVLRGPWEDENGQNLAMASSLLHTAEGLPTGAPIVSAAWTDQGTLRTSLSLDGGYGWYRPATIAEGVVEHEGHEGRVRLAMGAGRVLAVFAQGDPAVPTLAEREGADWILSPLSAQAQGALIDLRMVNQEPVAAWLDTRRGGAGPDVYAWVNGVEEPVYLDGDDGVCACCRPAVGELDGQPAIAFRDAEGPLREARVFVRGDSGWEDRGRVTQGGWSPGGCPADGPAWDGEALLISDARDGVRRIYRDDQVLASTEGWQAVAPRAAQGVPMWLELQEGKSRVVVAGQTALEMERSLAIGDPVDGAQGLLLPVQSTGAFALMVKPAPEPND